MKKPEPELKEKERELIESLIKYPSLEAVFERTSSAGFAEIKLKLQETVKNLERVIRRGEKREADRAAVALAAYQTTINFLNELEGIGKKRAR